MKLKFQPVLFGVTAVLGLSACGEGPVDQSANSLAAGISPDGVVAPGEGSAAVGEELSLAEGPDVCFRAIAKQLGEDAKVSEINSLFSAGNDIDGDASAPEGKMTNCTVEYQDPNDPRKLLSARLDLGSGTFGDPIPVEITVSGDAATFKLEDYLIPLSKVNAAALRPAMDAQKAKLGGTYGRYAWTAVRLTAPDAFSDTHSLRLDLVGRLAANDVKNSGYASFSTDGKSIKKNTLMP